MLALGFCASLAAQELPLPGDEDEGSTREEPVIASEPNSPRDDAEIQSRIEDIFSHLDELGSVSVEVEDGVVVLHGIVDSQDARDEAEALAQRVAGTVLVINNLSRDHSLSSRLKSTTRQIGSQISDLFALAPLLLLALLVIVVALLMARFSGRAESLYTRLSSNWFIRDLIRQLVQVTIFLAGVIIALQLLDATALLGSIVGALGILGLAIGFATRETVENYIASILLSLRQPFRRDDHVLIDDIEGIVMRLTPRATVLMQLDGNHLRIPNAQVFKSVIVNYTRNPLRRFEFQVGVDTDLDLNEPRALAIETLQEVPGVLSDPKPSCLVEKLGDSSVILRILGWIDQRDNDFMKVGSEAQQAVKEAYDAADIVMPEPIYNVNLRRPSAAAKRSARRAEASGQPDSQPDTDTPVGDTRPDDAVDRQIDAERRTSTEEDLLDTRAPTE